MGIQDNSEWNNALEEARTTARFLGYDHVTPGCILLGLARTSISDSIMRNVGITQEAILSIIPKVDGRVRNRVKNDYDLPFTEPAVEIVQLAKLSGEELGHPYRGPEHLAMGVGRSQNPDVIRLLGYLGTPGRPIENYARELVGFGPRPTIPVI